MLGEMNGILYREVSYIYQIENVSGMTSMTDALR